jgi:TRAP-type C4-dicarboxylate transport system permease large subunit
MGISLLGSVLFVGCAVGDIPIEESARSVWPFYAAMVGVLLSITAFPAISPTLPSLFGR